MRLSVVIPTFNRLPVLREVLASLDRCEPPDGGFEAVVVSDGSSDGTPAFLEGWKPGHPFRFLTQENSGPGRARNRGAELARGERILFLGDDTVPEPGLLVRHVARASREPDPSRIAVLGRTGWHPRMPNNPFLRHINENGLQFGYSIIPDPDDVPFNFFYTSNVSVSKELFARLGGFDTDFPAAAWEDVEFAWRGRRLGMRMVYEPEARTAHDHPTSVGTFLRRQRVAGRAAAIFAAKHPELVDWLGVPCIAEIEPRWRRRGWETLARIGERVPPLFSARICDRAMRQSYLVGLAEAWSAPPRNQTGGTGV
jgi:glycosyltransferase involved in cell wall biosynthesis